MTNENEIRAELTTVEAEIEQATEQLHCLEGKRDQIVLKLTDLDGAHDQRVVAVR